MHLIDTVAKDANVEVTTALPRIATFTGGEFKYDNASSGVLLTVRLGTINIILTMTDAQADELCCKLGAALTDLSIARRGHPDDSTTADKIDARNTQPKP